jgi:hypothetical protein
MQGLEKKLTYLSLALSVIAIALSLAQTFLQRSGRTLPSITNAQALKLQACTEILSKAVAFANRNAEMRLISAKLAGADQAENIDVLGKGDFGQKLRSKPEWNALYSEKQVQIEDLAGELNTLTVSRAHLFPRAIGQDLLNMTRTSLELMESPEGQNGVTHRDFTQLVKNLRANCSTISEATSE